MKKEHYKIEDIMTNTKISIILPISNEETHLKECLDYLVNQTLHEIEIICIYDPISQDKTYDILKEYALIDNRIRIIDCTNEDNITILGLKNSSGKYIHFITCNNWIEKDLYEMGYEKCESNDLDVLIFQDVEYNLITKEPSLNDEFDLFSRHENLCDEIFNANNLKNLMFTMPNSAPYLLFKRELLANINLSKSNHTEKLFFYKTILNSTHLSFAPKKVYSAANDKSFEDYSNIITLTNEIIELFKEMDFYDEYKSVLLNYKSNQIWQLYNKINKKSKAEMYNLIKIDFDNISENKPEMNDYELCLNEKNKLLFDNIINTKTYDEFLILLELQDITCKYENLKDELELYKIQNDKYQEQPNKQLNYKFHELSEKYQIKQTQLTQLNKDYAELSEKYLNLEKNLQRYTLKLDQLEYKTKLIEKDLKNDDKSKIKQLFKLKRFSK